MQQIFLSILAVVFGLIYIVVLLLRHKVSVPIFAQVGGLVALVVLEACDLGAVLYPADLSYWKMGAFVAEAWLPGCWLLYSLTFARQGGRRAISRLAQLFLLIAFVFPLVVFLPATMLFYSPDFVSEMMLFLRPWGYAFYVGVMALLVVTLFNLEQTLMTLPRNERWKIKFEIIGAGTILTVLVIYYSQALLYRSIDMNLMPVRSFSLISGICMMAYSRYRRGVAPARIRVSQELVYRSVVILSVGFYLVVLGVFGTGMRYLDLSDNRAFVVGLAIVVGLIFVTVLLSEKIQQRIRVTLHKNFYQQKYDYRNNWLLFTAKLERAKSREELEWVIVDFYSETFLLNWAALFLRDHEDGRYGCSACCERNVARLSMNDEHPLISQMREHDWVVDLNNTPKELVKDDWLQLHHFGASLLVPLRFDQRIEGFIALGPHLGDRTSLTYEDYDLMKILANQAIGVLLSHKLYADLLLAQEMAAIGRVSTFVIHDLKNLVSGLALVVDNSREYIDDPEFRVDMFETLENTVANMNVLIARLQHVKQQPQLRMAPADLLAIAKTAAHLAGNHMVKVDGESVVVRCDSLELQKVVLNLLHNAREASPEGAPIAVVVGCTDMAFLQVSDTGHGMSSEFISERLFKPFETTKKNGVGIGLYQCRQVIKAHGGQIVVRSFEGEGSIFTLWLPLEDKLVPPGESLGTVQ
jgi:hypothetical protein